MNRYSTIIAAALLACLGFSSCQREDLLDSVSDGSRIRLVAAAPGASLSLSGTKASGQTDYKGIINSGTQIDDGLVMGVLRVDQTLAAYLADGGGIAALNFKGASIADASFNPKDYTFGDTTPHYYCSQANLDGEPGVRYVDFDILQYYKNEIDVVHYFGWYPYGSPVASATDTFKVNFNLDGKTDVLYSSPATQIQDVQEDTMRLHHALCQYRVWVYRMTEVGEEGSEQGAGRWGRITEMISHNQNDRATLVMPSSVRFSYSTGSTPVDFNLNSLPHATMNEGVVVGAQNGLFYVTDEIVEGQAKTGVTIPLGEQKKRQIACYLAPPPANGTLSLSIHTDATGGGSESTNRKNLSIAGSFQPGSAYDIILCFSDHGVINAFASTGEWTAYGSEIDFDVEAKMYYDLSRYGTANCYMVSSANVGYSFQGNVKGCGNELGGGSIVGVEDCSLSEDCHVDIVYQSTPNLIKLDAQSLINGKVIFWVPGEPDESSLALVNKGSAIIAARKEKDGEILWSWHIWVTDRPQDQGYMNGYDAMDRNLGATSGPRTVSQIRTADASSYGLYYQWGRKDPMIPGATTWSNSALSNETECIATGIKNPMVMYSHWNVDDIESIMGYRDAQENIKTIYDPCPPGYRAPESEAFSSLSAMKTTVSGMTGVKGASFTGDLYNYFFYPDAGFISAKEGTYTSGSKIASTGANDNRNEIYLYTTSPEDFFDAGTGEIMKIDDLPTGSQASGIDYYTNQAASAFSIRCISTGSKTRVVNLCESQTANCYVVPSSGIYKFRVDIKGNGVNRVNLGGTMWNINNNADVNIPLSSINHVAVLWWQGDLSGRSTNNTAGTDCPIKFVNEGRSLPRNPAHNTSDFGETDITVPDAEGYVQFYVSENKWGRGNAVVAAFDASNNILWSWHLWLTEDPGDVNMGPYYSSSDSYTYEYTMMDRNLGATYHPTAAEFSAQALTGDTENKTLASVGMYYQWGRKDPIQGSSTFAGTYTSGSSSTSTKNWYRRNVSGNYGWATQTTIDVQEAGETMEESLSSPSSFYKNTHSTSIFIWQIGADRILYEKNWYAYKFGANDGILKRIFQKESVTVERFEINKFIGLWGFNTQSYSDLPKNPSMTKTMFDPCPPGYYIPPTSFLAAAAVMPYAYGSDETNKYTSSDFVWAPEQTWTAGSETHGVFLNKGTSYNSGTRTFVCDDNIWIPFGGYRDFNDGKFNTTQISSGTPSAVWFFGQDFKSEYYEYFAGVRAGVVTQSGSGYIRGIRPADGANVRCRAY